MNLLLYILSLFKKSPTPPDQHGAFLNPVDNRDIPTTAFQQPTDIPQRWVTDITMLPIETQIWGTCVAYAQAKLLQYFEYVDTGLIVTLIPGFIYDWCKQRDGVAAQGTYPRVGAQVMVDFGCASDDTLTETSDTYENYLKKDIQSQKVLDDAAKRKISGYAFVPLNGDAVAQAIYKNKVITGTLEVGDWSALPLKWFKSWLYHHTLWYGYEYTNNDLIIYLRNSWGPEWLKNILNWLFPGNGYFLWSEYGPYAQDIQVYTDIPDDLLFKAKNMQYRFTKDLDMGYNDPSVKELQKRLNEDPDTQVAVSGPGSTGNETTTFGSLTRAALARYQKKHGISPSLGYFGPITRNFMNQGLPPIALVDAMIQVESGGYDMAIGDRNLANHAYGCLQIRQGVVDDVNAKLKTTYRASDCLGNRDLSLKIFNTYWTVYPENDTNEERARCWNGGPGWREKSKTDSVYRSNLDAYWSRVSKLLS